jgi:hypothetical protein
VNQTKELAGLQWSAEGQNRKQRHLSSTLTGNSLARRRTRRVFSKRADSTRLRTLFAHLLNVAHLYAMANSRRATDETVDVKIDVVPIRRLDEAVA